MHVNEVLSLLQKTENTATNIEMSAVRSNSWLASTKQMNTSLNRKGKIEHALLDTSNTSSVKLYLEQAGLDFATFDRERNN